MLYSEFVDVLPKYVYTIVQLYILVVLYTLQALVQLVGVVLNAESTKRCTS